MNATTSVANPPGPPTLSDGDALFEVVRGRRVELPPMGAYDTDIASTLAQWMGHFVLSNKLGRVESEMLFELDAVAGLQRRPDVAFVSYERWPRNRRVPRTSAWRVIPDLAIEVVSQTNTAEEVLGKVREYFQAGVQLVWAIYPGEELAYVYHSPTQTEILTRTGTLDGENVVPGFQLPLADLFPEETETPA